MNEQFFSDLQSTSQTFMEYSNIKNNNNIIAL